ncbi:unnamed protein product [Caenorhabditis brenneri]
MQPSIRIALHFTIFLSYWFSVEAELPSGKLTKEENNERLETCGKIIEAENEYAGTFLRVDNNTDFNKYIIALSSRHVVLNSDSKMLGFTYNKKDCKNNIQKFTINTDQVWPGPLNENKQAYYIGSCEHNSPRGFVIVEQSLAEPNVYIPHCLPNSPIRNGTELQVFTTLNVTLQAIEYIVTKAHFCKHQLDEVCTKQLVSDFGGPVLDPVYDNKTYVGHSISQDNESIHIVPVYSYLKQICEITGICETSLDNNPSSLPSSLSKAKLSFVDADEPVIHVNFPVMETLPGDPIISSLHTFMNSEVIDGGETDDELDVMIEEIESSGEQLEEEDSEEESSDEEDSDESEIVRIKLNPETNSFPEAQTEPTSSGEKILILFKSEEASTETDYEPIVMSVVPQEKTESPAPEASTIVRAEPFSAVIIPLPEHNKKDNIRSEFSSPEELLIAFLIMLALAFYVLMCLYGCIDYKGKRNYWKPNVEIIRA